MILGQHVLYVVDDLQVAVDLTVFVVVCLQHVAAGIHDTQRVQEIARFTFGNDAHLNAVVGKLRPLPLCTAPRDAGTRGIGGQNLDIFIGREDIDLTEAGMKLAVHEGRTFLRRQVLVSDLLEEVILALKPQMALQLDRTQDQLAHRLRTLLWIADHHTDEAIFGK